MKTYSIRGLDKPVSAIGLGTMVFHPETRSRDHEMLDAFVEHGGTYVDTAEIYGAVEEYGHSESVIGDWLAQRDGMRERIVLASKGLIPGYCELMHPGGARIDPESIHRAIDGSLERLQTDYLDIWMFHRDDPFLPVGPLVDALDDEVRRGRLKAYGASNWTTTRIAEAIRYARESGKAEMMSSSPHFCLARNNEPYWPDTVVTDDADRAWFAERNFLLVAWSSLGRGFFAKGDPEDHSDADLVRVFYSDENFTRKARAARLAEAKGTSMFAVALGYLINQEFPVVALNGAESPEQVAVSAAAGDVHLSAAERDWLDLTSDACPI